MPNPRGRFDLGTIRAPLLLDRVSSAIDLINVRRVVSACGNVGEVRSHLAAFKRRLAHVEPDVRSAALVTQRREYVARELVHEGLLWKYVKEACSAITRVTACTLALSPIRDTLTGGFSHFVASMTAPVASDWSVCRVGLAATGKRRLVGCPFSPAAATHPTSFKRVGVSPLGGTCDHLSASARSIVNRRPRLPPSIT
jgi:hypothetical protein